VKTERYLPVNKKTNKWYWLLKEAPGMKDEEKTDKNVANELKELRQRVAELEASEIERMQTEKALQESEERLRRLIEHSTDAFFIHDFQGKIIDVNQHACDSLGYKREELLNLTIADIDQGFLPGKHLDTWEQMVPGEPVTLEGVHRRKGGTTFPVEVRLSVFESGNRKFMLGIDRDISDRKRTEEELRRHQDRLEELVAERTGELKKSNWELQQEITERKQAEKALRESEERYRILVENINLGVTLINTDHDIVMVNGAQGRQFKKPPRELIGKKCFREFEQRDEVCPHCPGVRAMSTGQPVEIETEGVRGDSSRYNARVQAFPIFGYDGRVTGFIEVVEDITERKLTEEEKNRLETQLLHAQKMESIGTLAGGIAHNFNNLLMGIIGNTSIMALDMDSDHTHYQNLKNIEKQVQSGSKLTSQLLGYAREGRYKVKPISINRLVKETSYTFGTTRKEIKFHRELSKHSYGIEADEGQIEQALLNLYINAADAMPGGGELFLKTMTVTHKDMADKPYKPKPRNYVLLTVRDTGIGMDKNTKERMFDPFFTTKGLAKGTGLGLASTYGIIKGHGGYIDVESEEGCGTTFSIYLPATDEEVKGEKELLGDLVEGKETVLLVDDEEIVLNAGEMMLRKLGYDVLPATSGQEALELFEKDKDIIDIILLDMVMPGISGGETFDKVKTINPEAKVLLSSGYSIHGEAKEILKRGCDGFIQKPFNLEQLSQSIREVLRNN